jgi:hypothetical protein
VGGPGGTAGHFSSTASCLTVSKQGSPKVPRSAFTEHEGLPTHAAATMAVVLLLS